MTDDPEEAAPPSGAKRGRPVGKLVLVAILVTILTAEVGVRVIDAMQGRDADSYAPADLEQRRYDPHPFLSYALRPGTGRGGAFAFQVNALGVRGPEREAKKPPGVYRILCLGGSTTFGTGVSGDDATYPAQLEQLLNQGSVDGRTYEVWNCGASGYTTAESLINLELRLLAFDPDAVIVYHAANDARPVQAAGFKTDYTHVRRAWVHTEVGGLERFLLRNIRLYAWATRGPKASAAGGTLAEHAYVPNVDELYTSPEVTIPEEGIDTYARNLRNIAAVARQHGAVPVFSTFATCRAKQKDTDKDYYATIARMNARMRELGEELDVEVLEVAPDLSDRPELYTDWMHCNDEGSREHARIVARGARRAGLFGLR